MRKPGHVTVEIENRGQYQTSVESFDATMERYWNDSIPQLKMYLNARCGGDIDYTDLETRTECLMILAEYDGLATN